MTVSPAADGPRPRARTSLPRSPDSGGGRKSSYRSLPFSRTREAQGRDRAYRNPRSGQRMGEKVFVATRPEAA